MLCEKGYDFEILENGLVSATPPVRLLEREACGESFYVHQVRDEQERIYKSIPEDVRASCHEEHRKNWICSILMRDDEKKYRPVEMLSVVKRTYVRRLTLNGRKPAQIGGTVSVRKG